MRDRRFDLSSGFAALNPDLATALWRPMQAVREANKIVGTTGDDSLTGTDGPDRFDMRQGGDDAVNGGAGKDLFIFGASFTGADRVDGGDSQRDNRDMVILNGDYSAGIVFESASIVDVEQLILKGGSYDISGVLGFRDRYGRTNIDASSLNADESLHFHAASNGEVHLTSGAGNDVIDMTHTPYVPEVEAGDGDDHVVTFGGNMYGGGGDDVLEVPRDNPNGGANLAGGDGDDRLIGGHDDYFDKLDGGAGADRVWVNSRYNQIVFGASTDSTALSYDVVRNFTGENDGGYNQLVLAFDLDTTKNGYQNDFHLGTTPGHIGDVVTHYDAALQHTIVDVFTDGDDVPDFTVHLIGNRVLTVNDFDTSVF